MADSERVAPGEVRRALVACLPRIHRYARRLSGSTWEADDLVQAACERALSRIDGFRADGSLEGWMYRTVQNLWLDGRRAAVVRGGDAEPVDPDTLDGIGDGIEARLMLERVRADLDRLPDDQRVVLLLVCVEGLSYSEAAATLDVPIGTIMSRLSRARRALHARLEGPAHRGEAPAQARGKERGR